jgi:hypothetical protein
MEHFADFIIHYIENNQIHGTQGWINQLNTYQWNNDNYSDGISTTQKFWDDSKKIINTPKNDDIWDCHCLKIARWGGMGAISTDASLKLKKDVLLLMQNNLDSDLINCPVCKNQIAMATKVFYFSDPLKWTIYDSRVGYAIHQLIFEYAKQQNILPKSGFPGNLFCLPPPRNSQKKRRNPLYKADQCNTAGKRSVKSFLGASHLHSIIASKLNSMKIPKPEYFLSDKPCWELPHIEMVFFMLGDSQWVDINEN